MISSRRCADQTESSGSAAHVLLKREEVQLNQSDFLSLFHCISPSSSPVAPALLSGNVSPSPAAGAQPPRGLWLQPPPSAGQKTRQFHALICRYKDPLIL